MKYRVSLIVTCRNYGRYLRQSLESALFQTRPFDEIILVDDDSEDDTKAVWESRFRDSVIYLSVTEHSQPRARWCGVQRSSGNLIAFLDADDWLRHDYLEKMLRPFESGEPNLGMVYSGKQVIREEPERMWFPYLTHKLREFDVDRLYSSYYFGNVPLFRRMLLNGMADFGFPLEGKKVYAEDWHLALRTALNGWVGRLVPERLVYYRVHGRNLSIAAFEREFHKDAHYRDWVRARVAPYDAAVIVPWYLVSAFQQRKWVESFKRLRLPADVQVISVESGQTGGDIRERRESSTHVLEVAFVGEEPEEIWKGRALQAARSKVRAPLVFLWDPSICLREDAFEKLHDVLRIRKADLAGARVLDPVNGRPGAWRAVKGDRRQGIFYVRPGRSPKRVFASDMGCLLMRSEVFWRLSLEAERKGEPCQGRVMMAGADAFERNYRWFVTGRVSPVRRDAQGRRVTIDRGACALSKNRQPYVSVVIPVRNDTHGLNRLLESLQRLDFPRDRMEWIVVDNGSVDGVSSVAERAGARVIHEPVPGSYRARNRGIRESSGELIAFVDADCEVTRSWLSGMVRALEEDPGRGCVAGTNAPVCPEAFLSRLERRHGGYSSWPGSPDSAVPPFAITMNAIFRRDVFEQAGFFSEVSSGADVEFSWRLAAFGGWKVFVMEDGGAVRHHDITSLMPWIERHRRIAEGHAWLYALYPQFTKAEYQWLPGKRWELIAAGVCKVLRGAAQDLFSGTLFREGALNAAREWVLTCRRLVYFDVRKLAENKTVFPGRNHVVRFLSGPLELYDREKGGLPARNSAQKCILVLAPCGAWASWKQWLISILGGTAVWEKSRETRVLQQWQLTPPFFGAFAGYWNRKVNAGRIKRLMRRAGIRTAFLTGDLSGEERGVWLSHFPQRLHWRELREIEEMGGQVFYGRRENNTFPLDADAYVRAAAFAKKVICISGCGEEDKERFSAACPNLILNPNGHRDSGIAAGLFLFQRESWGKQETTAEMQRLASMGIPVISTPLKDPNREFIIVSSFEETAAALHRYEMNPVRIPLRAESAEKMTAKDIAERNLNGGVLIS